MLALCCKRLYLFIGDSLHTHTRRLAHSKFHTSIRFQKHIDRDNGPLTLAKVGFGCETEITKNKKPKAFAANLESGVKVPSIKTKIPKAKLKQVEKNPIDPNSAPFAPKTFSELGLSPHLLETLEREGLSLPTDVQSTAIPTILRGHDVIIQSYTGSGKTFAYLLPILSRVGPLKEAQNGEGVTETRCIEAVIVCPSRELGMQIVREAEKILGPQNRKVVQQLVGGANRSRQEEALRKNKPIIVVGTPGRIAEISASGKLHTHGSRFLVLDEVDQLLSFNFREDMHRILEHVGRARSNTQAKRVERQTILVSATVPFAVLRAARGWGRDPLLVRAKTVLSLDSALALGSLSPSPSSSAITQAAIESLPPSLKHYYCITKLQHKVDTLRRCVHAINALSVIVFMNHTKQLKDTVFKLEARGIKAAALHGDLSKLERGTTLKNFKSGELRVLVTNELSARGLDVPECDLVVNLDLPTDSVHYAHRAGRTGRLGRKGSVVTICEEPEEFVVKKLERQLGIPIFACEFTEGQLVLQNNEKKVMIDYMFAKDEGNGSRSHSSAIWEFRNSFSYVARRHFVQAPSFSIESQM
ncbi:DEAD-box ATP-dependent RNA helicase 47B isoform X2 [Amborella trichopoda]|uniref:DEAD-box ATP-dependent RNA helicase 47B isoform X2 n=1 Tax=Amborella trichopoda TaxID=13333 RepID=UPI0009BF5EF2|nr:DEAD-box ATP-dependent RNA helicase 47B isoform X2 [Amborella trichopoda]|eukprot:XP_020525327.1 DEAD-box ATP-dependent RNA helicase 47B isoform X2 [Amborella trichopoda]